MQFNKPLQLVGGGLVGSLLSIYFARRGFDVEIFERRPDMRKNQIAAGRSINLAISTRGLSSLEQVDLKEKVMKICLPMHGRAVHGLDGKVNFQAYGAESQCIYSVSRGDLNKILMTEAEERYGVRIHFDHQLTRLDLDDLKAHFSAPEKNIEIDVHQFIGTDGSSSPIRSSILEKTKAKHSSEFLSYAYKELIIPARANGQSQMTTDALHIWPRKNFMLIALPNMDQSFTATLFLSEKGPMSFENLKTSEQLEQFFIEYFADAFEMLPHLQSEFFENPIGRMVTIKTDAWSFEDKALILGDAAHAIVPFFGQGMNCGFEDCRVLDQFLQKQNTDFNWQNIFEEFFKARKLNADAIADLAQENFIEMRDKVSDQQFLFHKAVERILMKNFSESYLSRYQMVSFSNIPYQMAKSIGVIEDDILKVLCQNLDKPENVDLARAALLIDQKLKPVLKNYLGKERQLWI
jgi:kynurenine 3-monooxygenase